MNDIILEFSLSQKAFHKQTLSEMLAINLERVLRRKQTDYLPIGIFKTHELADTFIESASKEIKNYSMFLTTEGKTVVVES